MLWCVPDVQAQRPGGFRVLGPGGGGAMFHPTISPHDPQTVLVACDMSGSYITHDGGQSWRMFNLRGAVRGFVFDPVDPKVIYAIGVGVWQSQDAGDTWRLLLPRPSKVTGIADASDEADVTIMANDETSDKNGAFGPPRAIAVDPLDHERLYVVIGGNLWHTKDGGNHWTEDDTLPVAIPHLALVHKNGDHGPPAVLMASDKGFWISRGFHPQQLPAPAGVKLKDEVTDVIDGRALVLATAHGGGLFQAWIDPTEKNLEVVWKELHLPGEGGLFTTTASGHDGKTLYASFSKLKLDGKVWEGVAKSEDLGEHWTLLLKDAGQGSPNIADGWMTASFGSDWGEEPFGIDVSVQDHALIYATDLGRTIKSTDGGAHWKGVYSHTWPDGGAVSTGLDVLCGFGVFFDPFDAQRMFTPYSDVGLMRSDNRGNSWWSSTDGVPGRWRATTYWMVFDPDVRGRVWAVMARPHDLPRSRIWRHTDPATYVGGVVESSDGGVHWTKTSEGMPPAAATHILLDPKSPPKARTLYVATMGHGVFKSVDGGKSWTAKNQGITEVRLFAWRLSLASDGTLYAVMMRESENGSIGNPKDGELYRSRDGAETWQKIALPDGVNAPTGLEIDPREPSRMVLSAWARDTGQRGLGGGIYGTTDGGGHWSVLLNNDQHIYDVTANPQNPSELYAAGFESSAWHSVDRGEHWQRIAGYNFAHGIRVTPDPANPGMVYINTFGGGVWYGKVDGKPGVEDIVSKEIAP
jgi:photosystem II stability/assembly factor-like uncharacterized protein